MATEVLPLLHVPPPVDADNVIVVPEHNALGPDIVAGAADTDTAMVATQPAPVE